MTAPPFRDVAEEMQGVFGTENVAPLLYALIRFTRPRRVLEVGAGLTTLYMLKALQDAIIEDGLERTSRRNIYGKTDWYNLPYRPKLTTLDDLSHMHSTASRLTQIASILGLDLLLDLRDEDFHGFSRRIPTAMLPLDLVWFDCGSLNEYLDFTEEFWPLVNPSGGLLVYHSTMTNVHLRAFVEAIAARQAEKGGFELMNLLEPHKKLQNSVSLVRKTCGGGAPLYTWEP